MVTLYRKYRPQSFKEIVGQNHIKITLEHEIETGKIAHAYLFCGPRAVGKTTLARLFSKSINCTSRKPNSYEPCNECENCETISSGKNFDIIEIDAASHTGVENVRENIIASSRVAPNPGNKYKVFIIDEVHMLSIPAFNALLKILEEPPANIIFILCTTEIHKIPSTIISRCQRFDFKRISIVDIVKKLNYILSKEGVEVENDILEEIARNSEGHMRDAESLLGQIIALGENKITRENADLVLPSGNLNEAVKMIKLLSKKDAGSAIRLINQILFEGINITKFTENLVELLRNVLFLKINPSLSEKVGVDFGTTVENKLSELSKTFELDSIMQMIELFMEAKNNIKKNFIMQLPLEIAIIKSTASPRSLPANPTVASRANSPAKQTFNKPAPPQETADKPSVNNKLDIEQIQSKWNDVLAKIKEQNHSLSFIMRACQPKNVLGDNLCLAFKYKFHKDRLNEVNIKNIISKILNDVYGINFEIEAVIDEKMEINPKGLDNDSASKTEDDKQPANEIEEDSDKNSGNNMVDNLLKTFGGKIIS